MDPETLLRAAQAFHRPDERLVRAAFISDDERRRLLDWALAMHPHLAGNGPERSYNRIETLPAVEPLVATVRARVQDLMKLGPDAQPEDRFGWYLSVISEGGLVHLHRDKTPAGTRHLRCNLFLQLPDSGGRPVIGNLPIDVVARTLLAFYASERDHCSEPVIGPHPRIILSFGYTVPAAYRLPN